MPLVRAAASGLSSAFDPWGRVLGVSDYFAAGDRTLTVQVPMGRVPTIYARTGDLFAWLCVAALVMALGVAAVAPGIQPAERVSRRGSNAAAPAGETGSPQTRKTSGPDLSTVRLTPDTNY